MNQFQGLSFSDLSSKPILKQSWTDAQCAHALRMLSIDAIEKAGSGHPGMPMGMADVATVLWKYYLRHDPQHPEWINRDRWVVSNGHGSMLIYALLHLTGYDVTMEDLQSFRQLHSKTPGHPEKGHTPGVETTTGPLGQGLANAVGMALSEKMLAARWNQPSFPIIDHYTYVFLGDGCLMEGVSHEACALAGCWNLHKLILFWDHNQISIDGRVDPWFREDVLARFKSYGFQTWLIDGHDHVAIHQAIQEARRSDRPAFIACRTVIGYGSPHKSDSAACHGSPLGVEEVQKTREMLNWIWPPFEIPDACYQAWRTPSRAISDEEYDDDRNDHNHADGQPYALDIHRTIWLKKWKDYERMFPDLAMQLSRLLDCSSSDMLSQDCIDALDRYQTEHARIQKAIATRAASQQCIEILTTHIPHLIGGSADLTHSNLTHWFGAVSVADDMAGRYIHYGVREFGMAAVMNGLALHHPWIVFGGTFLVFSDYMRPAIRLAAMMRTHVIFVLTHDSVGVGEDGPTHQPIEHIASLRLIPHLTIWRPCDAIETAAAWQWMVSHRQPSCLILSRQSLPILHHPLRHTLTQDGIGFVYTSDLDSRHASEVDIICFSTGSEVHLACRVADQLRNVYQIHMQVVSIPSLEVAQRQGAIDDRYGMPHVTCRVAIEAGVSQGWHGIVGDEGLVIGIDQFGYSGKAESVFQALGFGQEALTERIYHHYIRRKKVS